MHKPGNDVLLAAGLLCGDGRSQWPTGSDHPPDSQVFSVLTIEVVAEHIQDIYVIANLEKLAE